MKGDLGCLDVAAKTWNGMVAGTKGITIVAANVDAEER